MPNKKVIKKKEPSVVVKSEYLVKDFPLASIELKGDTETLALNRFIGEGWDLVAVSGGKYYFKREKPEG